MFALSPRSLLAAVSEPRLERVCGEDPGWACREALEETNYKALSLAAEFLVGKPLTILGDHHRGADRQPARAARGQARRCRACTRAASRSASAPCAAARPAALLETEEISLRATQRIEALATVLRSVVSFVIWRRRAAADPRRARHRPRAAARRRRDHRRRARLRLADARQGLPVGPVHPRRGPVRRRRHRRPRPEASGIVEAVSLRTTRLRAVDGTVWHVPNGEIRRVGNKSQHWSRALLDVEVAYDTDIEHASERDQARGRRGLERARARCSRSPSCGASRSSAPSGVAIRLVVKTTPSEQWAISRELRQRIKAAFDHEGIEIPT